MDFAELWRLGNKQKNQNEKKYIQRGSNRQPFALQAGALDNSATLTDDELCFNVWYLVFQCVPLTTRLSGLLTTGF